MAPKTAAKKAAAKSQPAGGSGAAASPDERWVRSQLTALEAQRRAAAASEPWVQEPHKWHEAQLEEVLERLQQGTLASVPSELREGVEFYVSQFASGEEVTEEAFYDDREMYKDVLKPVIKTDSGAYVRAPDSPEDLKAIEQLNAMSDTSPHGISKLAKLLKEYEASAGVQVAGLNRLVVLLGELRGAAPGPTAQGLLVPSVLPIVKGIMAKLIRDAEVQRRGCVILRVFAAADWALATMLEAGGAELAVAAGKAHLADVEVCRSSVAVISTMVSNSPKNSVEWSRLRSSGASDFLVDVTRQHPLDERLDKVARTALPFLKD